MKFSRILYELREGRFMSKTTLAKKVNISRTQIRAYENDTSIPNIHTLVALADVFGVSTDFLVGRVGYITLPLTSKKRYVTLSDELSDEECELVEEFAEMLRNKKNRR